MFTYVLYSIAHALNERFVDLLVDERAQKSLYLIPCENSNIKTLLQLDHKTLLEVFSPFDSVCPKKRNWKLSTSCPVINTSFGVVVEAKVSKERLHQCNNIQVKAPALRPQTTVPSQIGFSMFPAFRLLCK